MRSPSYLRSSVKGYRTIGNSLEPVPKIPPGSYDDILWSFIFYLSQSIIPTIMHAGDGIKCLGIAGLDWLDQQQGQQQKYDYHRYFLRYL